MEAAHTKAGTSAAATNRLRVFGWIAAMLSASVFAHAAAPAQPARFSHDFGMEIISVQASASDRVVVALSEGKICSVSAGPNRKVVWSQKLERSLALATESRGNIAVLIEGGNVALLTAMGKLLSISPSGIELPDSIGVSDHNVVVLSGKKMAFSTLSWNGAYLGKCSGPLPDICRPLSTPWGVYVNGIDELLASLPDRPKIVHSITRTMYYPPDMLGNDERIYSLWMLRRAVDIWTKNLELVTSIDFVGGLSSVSIAWDRGQRIAVLQRNTVVSVDLASRKSVALPRPSNTLDHFGEINGHLVMVSEPGDVFACGPEETVFRAVGSTEANPVSMFTVGQEGRLIVASGSRLEIQPAEALKSIPLAR